MRKIITLGQKPAHCAGGQWDEFPESVRLSKTFKKIITYVSKRPSSSWEVYPLINTAAPPPQFAQTHSFLAPLDSYTTIMSGDDVSCLERKSPSRQRALNRRVKWSDKIFDGFNCKSRAWTGRFASAGANINIPAALFLLLRFEPTLRLKTPKRRLQLRSPQRESRHRHPSSPHFKSHAAPSLSVSLLRQ